MDNYEQFITHPLTILTAAGILLLVFLGVLFETCGILACFERTWRKEKITLPGIVRSALKGGLRFIRKYPLRWILYMAGCTPFLTLHLVIWEMTRAKLAAVTLQKLAAAVPVWALAVILTVIFTASMFFSFTMPQRLFGWRRGKRCGRIPGRHSGDVLAAESAAPCWFRCWPLRWCWSCFWLQLQS